LFRAARLVPPLPTHSHTFDWLGVALSGAGMFLLVFGIQEGHQYDWSTTIWALILAGMLMVVTTTVMFYMITAFTPTFGKTVLMMSDKQSFFVTLCVGISNLFWLPVMGSLSDRYGRRPLLLLFTVLMILTAWPVLHWLVGAPSLSHLLEAELWLSFLYGSYNGAMVVYLTEVMPAEVRATGFSLAYSLATAIFGGFTPVISTALIEYTGDKASPGYWMSFAAVCALAATLYLYRRVGLSLQTAR
jgi:MFS family permease